jgi:hypothetical protein
MLDHGCIGIIVIYAVVKLLGNILINLLFRVVFPGHPDSYWESALMNTREIRCPNITSSSDTN